MDKQISYSEITIRRIFISHHMICLVQVFLEEKNVYFIEMKNDREKVPQKFEKIRILLQKKQILMLKMDNPVYVYSNFDFFFLNLKYDQDDDNIMFCMNI